MPGELACFGRRPMSDGVIVAERHNPELCSHKRWPGVPFGAARVSNDFVIEMLVPLDYPCLEASCKMLLHDMVKL